MVKNSIILLIILVVLFPLNSMAVSIVDTGTPAANAFLALRNNSPDDFQFLAAEFSLADNTTLTDIYGFINPGSSSGEVTAVIYGDGGDIPDSGNLLFSDTFNVPPLISATGDWYGLTGLNWELLSGTYWLSFEVGASSTFDGAMPTGAPNPLINEAYNNNFSVSNGNWIGNDNFFLGIRIDGFTTVPEPSTLLLFGTGLVGIGIFRRKFRG